MNKLLIILLMAFAVGSHVNAQELGVAINVKNNHDAEDNDVNKALIEVLKTKSTKNAVIYNWNQSKLELVELEDRPERPCQKVVFVEPRVSKSDKYKPEVIAQLDTNGIATSAHFNIFYELSYNIKGIDLASGEVQSIDPTYKIEGKQKFGARPISIDVKKYFGRTKYKTVQKNWSRYSKTLYTAYKESILKKRNELKSTKKQALSTIPSYVKNMFNRDVYPIKKNEKVDGKIKTVSVDMTNKSPLKKHNLLEVYAPSSIAGKKTIEYVTYLEVESVEGNTATAGKTFIQSGKKLSKKLEAQDELYAVTNKDIAHLIVPDERERINIAIDTKTRNRESYEKTLLSIPIIRLVERGYQNELKFLRQKYKDERFMDYDMGSIQDKLQGAKYIVTIENDNVNLIDVATSQLVAVDTKEGKRNWFASGYTTNQALNMALMKVSNTSIEFLETTKAKKNKVTKIRLFHPIGFAAYEKLDILVKTEEEVGGKMFERKKYIGNGYVSADKHNSSIGELKINRKGRKAFYEAMTNNEQFEFIYSIKRD